MRFFLAFVPALAIMLSVVLAPPVSSARLEGFNKDQRGIFKRSDPEWKKARKAERKRMRRQRMTDDD